MKKKKYKALLLDIDGTIVRKGYENLPTDAVKKAIASLHKRGIPVCLATGRTIQHAKRIIDALDITHACILNGGAAIYDPKIKKTVRSFSFDEERKQKLITIGSALRERFLVCTTQGEFEYEGQDFSQEDVTSFYFIHLQQEEIELYTRGLSEVQNLRLHLITRGTFDGMPVIIATDADTTKIHAIHYLFEYTKIHAEDIVAVGDEENDLPMLTAVGMSVAMGNAPDNVKVQAKYVAPSVYEDGLVDVIERYF